MSTKKQSDKLEMVRDATTGYAVVVLGIVCFILALIVVTAGVRIVVGTGGTGAATGTAAAAGATQGATTGRAA